MAYIEKSNYQSALPLADQQSGASGVQVTGALPLFTMSDPETWVTKLAPLSQEGQITPLTPKLAVLPTQAVELHPLATRLTISMYLDGELGGTSL